MAIKFFCENCGSQVPLYEESCPNCKKAFFAVMCPLCKKEGMPREFVQGCPACGYMSRRIKRRTHPPGINAKSVKQHATRSKPKSKKLLPLWCYKGAVVLLLLSITGLIIYILLTIR